MPHDTAATWPISGTVLITFIFCMWRNARLSATQAPVMAAQRVPPSAFSTSQSSVMLTSPIRVRSTTARRARPIRRWISWVRPDCLPRAASRSPRVWVARGSMPYSAVTQPWPELRRNGGTRPSTLAAQRTSVLPMRIRQEPSAWRAKPVVSETGRSSVGVRPDGRMSRLLCEGRGQYRRQRVGCHPPVPGRRVRVGMPTISEGGLA